MKSVRLPTTEFSPHNLSQFDAREVSRLRKAVEADMPERFRLHDGPPYANGHTHLGHALNKVLKDAMSRSQFLLGKSALFKPGWDCHGLPTEWAVEQKLKGENRFPLSTSLFRKECEEFAGNWQAVQSKELQSLGVLADWDHPYLSMDKEADAGTLKVFHDFVSRGLVYRGLRPTLWSVVEQTALADAEVEERNLKYQSLLVRFTMDTDKSLVVWTSTPWSLPGNRLVAVNADLEYVELQVLEVSEKSKLLVGETLVVSRNCVSTLEKAGLVDYATGASYMGSELCSRTLKDPLYGQDRAVVAADFVKDAGTGAVHVAPSLGEDDFYLCAKLGVPLDNTLNGDGSYHKSVKDFAGQHVMFSDGTWGPAQGLVLQRLADNGKVAGLSYANHMAPHSWRSKSPLFTRVTSQFFVDCKELSRSALEELKTVKFNSHYRNRLESMVANRPDWCVSRQRSWGVPLGLFVDKYSGEVLSDQKVLSRTQDLFRQHGSNCWFDLPSEEFLEGHDSSMYEKVQDVLDVWFESGSTWAWVMEGQTSDVYWEGSDQHRGWFQSSLLTSTALRNEAPYRTLLTHGFVLDHSNTKMSKSMGNGTSPKEACEAFGVDALRWMFLNCDTSNDVRYDAKSMANSKKAVVKMGNTLKWMLGVLDSKTYNVELGRNDQRFLAFLAQTEQVLKKQFEYYDLMNAAKTLWSFVLEVSNVMVSYYRDSLYCDADESQSYQAAQVVVRQFFEALAAWSSVFVPVVSEAAWSFYDSPVRYVSLLHGMGRFSEYHDANLLEEYQSLTGLRSELLSGLAVLKEPDFKNSERVEATVESCLDFDALAKMSGFAKVCSGERGYKVVDWLRCDRCRSWKADVKEDGLCLRCSE